MGILSGIFKSRDKPQNATSGSAYRFFIGGSSSGKNVNERSAMQMTAVYSCVRILSEAVASLPLHVYKYNDEGGKEKAVKHPLYFLLHDEPNPEMTSFVFRETLMTHLLLWGNAYAQIIRSGKGEIVALYPLMPNRMTVDRDEKGQLYYQYNTSKDDAPTMNGSMVNLKPSDVLHGAGKPLGIFAEEGGAQVGVTTASATEITADEIINLIYALKRPYRKKAKFIMNDQTIAVLRKLKDENGQYLWQPSLQAGEPDRLLGYEVMTSAYVPVIASGKPVIAFGDFSYYNIGDRGVRSFAELKELFAGNGMVGFVAKERVDGKLVLAEAVQVLKMGA